MKFGSLFSGIGGIDIGLERAGMACAWQVEKEPFCVGILRNHWPSIPRWGEVAAIGPGELPPVDLLAAGFPCQPVSLAGSGKVEADPRWLWPAVARIAGDLRPPWILLENVPGLVVRGALGLVLRDLARLGYDATWDCFPAAAIGAPHLRNRFWLVAHTDGGGLPRFWQSELARVSRPSWRFPDRRCSVWQFTDSPLGPWETEPRLGRLADGVPDRVGRLRALGNSVVPQAAEWIGRRIMQLARGDS